MNQLDSAWVNFDGGLSDSGSQAGAGGAQSLGSLTDLMTSSSNPALNETRSSGDPFGDSFNSAYQQSELQQRLKMTEDGKLPTMQVAAFLMASQLNFYKITILLCAVF